MGDAPPMTRKLGSTSKFPPHPTQYHQAWSKPLTQDFGRDFRCKLQEERLSWENIVLLQQEAQGRAES